MVRDWLAKLRGKPLPLRSAAIPEFRYFLTAVQFLTRIPVPSFSQFDETWFSRSVRYFPLVGALIGSLSAAVLLIGSALWHGPIPALLAIAAGILITGALHEDGFSDFFDSLGAATKEARLVIMKDSRIGAYGALALGFSVAVRIFALASIPVAIAAVSLISAHALARFSMLAVMRFLPYARQPSEAKIRPPPVNFDIGTFAPAFVFCLLPLTFIPWSIALAAAAASLAAAGLIGLSAYRSIGGFTGDVLGAAEQAVEIAFLLGVSACV